MCGIRKHPHSSTSQTLLSEALKKKKKKSEPEVNEAAAEFSMRPSPVLKLQ